MHWNNKIRPRVTFIKDSYDENFEKNSVFRRFKDDEGTGGGNGNGNGNSDGKPEDKEKKEEDGNGKPGEKPGDKPEDKDNKDDKENKKEKDDKKFTQSDVDKIVQDRLDRERQKQEGEKLKAQGEFQKLYEASIPKIEALEKENEGLKTTVKKLSEDANKQIDSLTDKWPKELKELDPGKEDAEARMAWYQKHLSLAKRLGVDKKAPDDESQRGEKDSKTNVAASYIANTYSGPVQKK